MSVKELKKYLDKIDEDTSGKKAELEKRFRKSYKVPKNVVDVVLYHQIRERVKRRVKRWPSAYASGQVVTEYKREGGRYKGKKKDTDLDRWYQEHWVNICEKDSKGNYLDCSSSQSKRYPYCRPSIRITKDTPKTVDEIGKTKIKEMCSKKTSKKRIYV
jgi:hypothetical protein